MPDHTTPSRRAAAGTQRDAGRATTVPSGDQSPAARRREPPHLIIAGPAQAVQLIINKQIGSSPIADTETLFSLRSSLRGASPPPPSAESVVEKTLRGPQPAFFEMPTRCHRSRTEMADLDRSLDALLDSAESLLEARGHDASQQRAVPVGKPSGRQKANAQVAKYPAMLRADTSLAGLDVEVQSQAVYDAVLANLVHAGQIKLDRLSAAHGELLALDASRIAQGEAQIGARDGLLEDAATEKAALEQRLVVAIGERGAGRLAYLSLQAQTAQAQALLDAATERAETAEAALARQLANPEIPPCEKCGQLESCEAERQGLVQELAAVSRCRASAADRSPQSLCPSPNPAPPAPKKGPLERRHLAADPPGSEGRAHRAAGLGAGGQGRSGVGVAPGRDAHQAKRAAGDPSCRCQGRD